MAASAGESRIVPNKGAKSPVWDYFGFPCDVDGAVNDRRVVCRLCKLELPYSRNTTNLFAHLQTHHKAQYIALKRTGTATSSKQETLVSTVARSQPLSPSSDRHKTLVAAVGTYLAKDMHPLAAVEGTGFLHLMEVAEPRFTVPCRKYFSKTVIPAMYSQEKEKVQRSLDEVTFCSITTDLWTAQHQNKGYIGLTAHFVDADWVMQSRCLETREMPVAHNAENIADELDQEMKEWNIRRKVYSSNHH